MKTIILILSVLFIGVFAIVQTKESKLAGYTWKGKRTLSQKGYVVLKSEKNLEVKIPLISSQKKSA